MSSSRRFRPGVTAAVLCGLIAFAACSPQLAPLYTDYEIGEADRQQTVQEEIASALEDAGWELAPSSADNVVATEERTLRNWGLYRVRASVEAVPIGDDHVRLYVHPYRHYITGNRSKIPFFKRSLRSQLLPSINEAFGERGYRLVGTPLDPKPPEDED